MGPTRRHKLYCTVTKSVCVLLSLESSCSIRPTFRKVCCDMVPLRSSSGCVRSRLQARPSLAQAAQRQACAAHPRPQPSSRGSSARCTAPSLVGALASVAFWVGTGSPALAEVRLPPIDSGASRCASTNRGFRVCGDACNCTHCVVCALQRRPEPLRARVRREHHRPGAPSSAAPDTQPHTTADRSALLAPRDASNCARP